VTICTQNRKCLFGDVVDGEMVLNDAGQMIKKWYIEGKLWQRNYYEHIIRDENELNRIREYII